MFVPLLVKENFNIIPQFFLVEQNVRQTTAISHFGYGLSKGLVVAGCTFTELANRKEVRLACSFRKAVLSRDVDQPNI